MPSGASGVFKLHFASFSNHFICFLVSKHFRMSLFTVLLEGEFYLILPVRKSAPQVLRSFSDPTPPLGCQGKRATQCQDPNAARTEIGLFFSEEEIKIETGRNRRRNT